MVDPSLALLASTLLSPLLLPLAWRSPRVQALAVAALLLHPLLARGWAGDPLSLRAYASGVLAYWTYALPPSLLSLSVPRGPRRLLMG